MTGADVSGLPLTPHPLQPPSAHPPTLRRKLAKDAAGAAPGEGCTPEELTKLICQQRNIYVKVCVCVGGGDGRRGVSW